MPIQLPIAIGQYHALHMLIEKNPGLAVCIVLLLIVLAFYFNRKR